MSKCLTIAAPGYVPTAEDCIRTRAKTTGIHEAKIQIGSNNYSIIDVGGQRSERKKWIHCFSDVTGVFFIVSASEYDQVTIEDGKTVP